MGVFSDAIDEAFNRYVTTGDIFWFASDMADIGDRCRYQWHANYVHDEIAKRKEKVPKHIPRSQALKYLMAKKK